MTIAKFTEVIDIADAIVVVDAINTPTVQTAGIGHTVVNFLAHTVARGSCSNDLNEILTALRVLIAKAVRRGISGMKLVAKTNTACRFFIANTIRKICSRRNFILSRGALGDGLANTVGARGLRARNLVLAVLALTGRCALAIRAQRR
jgi:hypothetical protein